MSPSLHIRVALAGLLAGSACIAYSQTFPVKPIRFVTSELGGGSDFVARLVASGLAPNLGQQIIAKIKFEKTRMGKVIREAGIKAN